MAAASPECVRVWDQGLGEGQSRLLCGDVAEASVAALELPANASVSVELFLEPAFQGGSALVCSSVEAAEAREALGGAARSLRVAQTSVWCPLSSLGRVEDGSVVGRSCAVGQRVAAGGWAGADCDWGRSSWTVRCGRQGLWETGQEGQPGSSACSRLGLGAALVLGGLGVAAALLLLYALAAYLLHRRNARLRRQLLHLSRLYHRLARQHAQQTPKRPEDQLGPQILPVHDLETTDPKLFSKGGPSESEPGTAPSVLTDFSRVSTAALKSSGSSTETRISPPPPDDTAATTNMDDTPEPPSEQPVTRPPVRSTTQESRPADAAPPGGSLSSSEDEVEPIDYPPPRAPSAFLQSAPPKPKRSLCRGRRPFPSQGRAAFRGKTRKANPTSSRKY